MTGQTVLPGLTGAEPGPFGAGRPAMTAAQARAARYALCSFLAHDPAATPQRGRAR